MTWLYKILIAVLIIILGYFVYSNILLNKRVTDLQTQAIESEQVQTQTRQYLIDSVSKTKILITAEILKNNNTIQKLKEELKKTNKDTITLQQAIKILGL